eukprot:gnl/Trimastix_PCT/4231.p1 GENE.gnl/Trimastix_PCT/4231~~gnl/Trimastix_PCT/4231.p1  ORF type:complete len:504 (-),score=124.36 gnl/Trimastix_PCT/4231:99-1610(-)
MQSSGDFQPLSPSSSEAGDQKQKISVFAVGFIIVFGIVILSLILLLTNVGIPKPIDPDGAPKFLVFSDAHIDPYYTPGSPTTCGDAKICCRGQRDGEEAADALPTRAGYWGTGGQGDVCVCEIPERTMEDALSKALSLHNETSYNITHIFYLGGSTPHVPKSQQTQSFVLNRVTRATTLIRKYFPNTPIVPLIGDTDTVPLHQMGTAKEGFAWLYKSLAKLWASEIGDSKHEFNHAGYYSVRPRPGLLVIALNTQLWIQKNKVQISDLGTPVADPGGQFAWLKDELSEAKRRMEAVHILMHHPPGYRGQTDLFPDMWPQHMRKFHSLWSQFASHIQGVFAGNLGVSAFRVAFRCDGDKSTQPFGAAFLNPSLTTYGGLNPAFAVYSYDPTLFTVLDAEEWVMDLPKSNQYSASHSTNATLWDVKYGLRDEYKAPTVTPFQLGHLVRRMASKTHLNPLFHKYYRALYSSYKPPIPLTHESARAQFCSMLILGNPKAMAWCAKKK